MQVQYAHQNVELFRHLDVAYERIVKPMELELKSLVISIHICSEAEIFASNLQFKVFQ